MKDFKDEAKARCLVAFIRHFLNFMNLGAFYSTTIKSLDIGKPQIEAEWQKSAQQGAETEAFKRMLKQRSPIKGAQFMDGMAQALASRSVRLAKQTVDSAALVFAHTILDDTLSECCQISFLASPADWYSFVKKRKVEIEALRDSSHEDLVHQIAKEHVKELQRESMVKRLQVLNQVNIPFIKDGEIPTASIKMEALEEFDGSRHRIIHGRYFSRPVRAIEDQIHFAKVAGFSALLLVAHAHDLLNGNEKTEPKSIFGALRMFAVFRREFPEFFEMIQRHVENDDKEGTEGP